MAEKRTTVGKQSTLISGRPAAPPAAGVKIPIRDLALNALEHLFPNLTPAQCEALRAGKPLPPSPEWVAANQPTVTDDKLEPRLNKLQAHVYGLLASEMSNGMWVAAILRHTKREQANLARHAINQFAAQSYPKKWLVVVNTTGTPLVDGPYECISEHIVDAATPAGDVEDFAWRQAHRISKLVYPDWSVDTIHDKHLLSYLLRTTAGISGLKDLVALRYELRVDIQHNKMHVIDVGNGQRRSDMICLPTDLQVDYEFLIRHFRVAVPDQAFNNANHATLKIGVWHGMNDLASDTFMGTGRPPTPEEAAYAKARLAEYGVTLS